MYCKIFIDSQEDKISLMKDLSTHFQAIRTEVNTLFFHWGDIHFACNDEYDPQKAQTPDGFLFYKYILDMEFTTADYINLTEQLLTYFREKGVATVAACDYEEKLIKKNSKQMIQTRFSITTDTATLSVFDLQSLQHRLDDTPDWWSIERDALQESNQGNVLFLNFDQDGTYHIEICDSLNEEHNVLYLNVPSGSVFVGAGEDTTGGELTPEDSEYVSGEIITLPIGKYQVQFAKQDNTIQLMFLPAEQSTNNLSNPIRL